MTSTAPVRFNCKYSTNAHTWPRNTELMKAFVGINHPGLGYIWCLALLITQSWQMKRNRMFSAYTVHWMDISSVKFCISDRASSARRSRTTGRSTRVSEEAPSNRTDII
ncbi:TPA: DUF4113 domain-containing protein [Enterobacter asburiae]